ncbi:MAG: hypothetical protein SPL12_07875 [Bacteroidales bacterium]|nr:hypothetical protein [Bacteroidales bacterium]
MVQQDNQIRIGKQMVAWSDGDRVHIIPSLWRELTDEGRLLADLRAGLREGDEYYYSLSRQIRDESRCREYYADCAWKRGERLRALHLMLWAATSTLPDEAQGYEFEDMQWLDPEEVPCWHPNVREFLRLMHRCIDLCREAPHLRPALEGDPAYQAYKDYLAAVRRWALGG